MISTFQLDFNLLTCKLPIAPLLFGYKNVASKKVKQEIFEINKGNKKHNKSKVFELGSLCTA